MDKQRLHIVILDDWDDICATAPAVQRLRGSFDVTIHTARLKGADLAAAIAKADILIPFRERSRIRAKELAGARKLRLIAQTGGGAAHVDTAALRDAGITITLTPGGSAPSVGELVMGLALAHDHRIVVGDRLMQQGEWQTLLGRDTGTQSLGLLGFGATAQAVVTPAQAVGMCVAAWSRSLSAADVPDGVSVAPSIEALLGQSDILSVHLPLNGTTRGFMDAERIAAMKPGALLINTSRGAIVDTDALIAAIERGHLRGACLDVFDPEPLPGDHPLRRRGEVILTPHVGWTTADTIHRFLAVCEENIHAFLAGSPSNVLEH